MGVGRSEIQESVFTLGNSRRDVFKNIQSFMRNPAMDFEDRKPMDPTQFAHESIRQLGLQVTRQAVDRLITLGCDVRVSWERQTRGKTEFSQGRLYGKGQEGDGSQSGWIKTVGDETDLKNVCVYVGPEGSLGTTPAFSGKTKGEGVFVYSVEDGGISNILVNIGKMTGKELKRLFVVQRG